MSCTLLYYINERETKMITKYFFASLALGRKYLTLATRNAKWIAPASGFTTSVPSSFVSIGSVIRIASDRSTQQVLKSCKFNPREPSIPIIDEMPANLPPLNNYYYLLRHGQSTANVEGIISSARSLAGSAQHGLTVVGWEQGRDSASSLVNLIADDISRNDSEWESTRKLYFYSSPFARAKETAYACLKGMRENTDVATKVKEMGLHVVDAVFFENRLMERYFGRLDGKELSTYSYVWPVDMFLPTHTAFDVESVAAVSTRIRSALLHIDSQHTRGNHIVLTSHADVLQITQVYAAGLKNVGMFSQYRFKNGEVRKMGRSLDSLPEPVPLQPPKRGA